MAKNFIYEEGDAIPLAATDPTTPVSGGPLLCGQLPGVAVADEDPVSGLTSTKTNGVPTLSVKGVNGSGSIAVAAGDIIYYVSGDTPVLSKKATGVRFGYALGVVGSGATATIPVKIGY